MRCAAYRRLLQVQRGYQTPNLPASLAECVKCVNQGTGSIIVGSKQWNKTSNAVVQVPEISAATKPKANAAALLDKVKRGQAAVGKAAAVPMLIGPVTIARLSQLDGITIPQCVEMLLPAYSQLLAELKSLGVSPPQTPLRVDPAGIWAFALYV